MKNEISKEELDKVFEKNKQNIAIDICIDLAAELDKPNIIKKIDNTIEALEKLPNDVAKQIIKNHIGIDRIIHNNLDCYEKFYDFMNKIHSTK